MNWTLYLSGEIHTDWRRQIMQGTEEKSLPILYSSAVTHHAAIDAAGDSLGEEDNPFCGGDPRVRDQPVAAR